MTHSKIPSSSRSTKINFLVCFWVNKSSIQALEEFGNKLSINNSWMIRYIRERLILEMVSRSRFRIERSRYHYQLMVRCLISKDFLAGNRLWVLWYLLKIFVLIWMSWLSRVKQRFQAKFLTECYFRTSIALIFQNYQIFSTCKIWLNTRARDSWMIMVKEPKKQAPKTQSIQIQFLDRGVLYHKAL